MGRGPLVPGTNDEFPHTCRWVRAGLCRYGLNRGQTKGEKAPLPATPELRRFIAELIETSVAATTASLGDIRTILLGNDMLMSGEGEIVYKQDRTSLLIELDELIEQRGIAWPVGHLLITG